LPESKEKEEPKPVVDALPPTHAQLEENDMDALK
jgi:hypothetical protein